MRALEVGHGRNERCAECRLQSADCVQKLQVGWIYSFFFSSRRFQETHDCGLWGLQRRTEDADGEVANVKIGTKCSVVGLKL